MKKSFHSISMTGFILLILIIAIGLSWPKPLYKKILSPISKIGAGSQKQIYYQNEAVILLYHDVDKRECGTAITSQRFASHMQMLEESGFAIVSLQDVEDFINNRKVLPANAVAITLDDACVSNYQQVFPALQAKHWPFAIFVTINEIGKTRPNGLARLNWEEIKEMSQAGVIVGSHTYNGHEFWINNQGQKQYWLTDRLKNETSQQFDQRVLADLVQSRKKLEQELKKPTFDFAPPFGAFNDQTVRLAKQAGYKYIWTTRRTPVRKTSSPVTLGRVSVGIKGTSSAELKTQILEVAKKTD